MKIIFLDFDGVINDYTSFNSVNVKCLNILKTIVDETNAKIVVTSSTKNNYLKSNKKEETICYKYINILKKHNIEVIDFTKKLKTRELEINDYLISHENIEAFLILDDDYIIEQYKDHEIYIDLQTGLKESHINPSINILNNNLKFYHDTEEIYEDDNTKIKRLNKRLINSNIY